MELSFFATAGRVSALGAAILSIAAIVALYCSLSGKPNVLMFLIALSAASVGSTIVLVDNVASLIRWLSILALLLSGVLVGRIRLSPGLLFFWGYVFLGFAFLFWAVNVSWQVQKTILLMLVTLAVTLGFSTGRPETYQSALMAVAVAAAAYAALSFLPLTTYLNNPMRYAGFSKEAPSFVASLGALLPFALWGFWQAGSRAIKVVCGCGFLLGAACLILSGQRAGLVAGLVALVPLLVAVARRQWRTALAVVLVLAIAILLVGLLLEQSSAERRAFLAGRYSAASGLSGRELIWRVAIGRIAQAPLLGRGIGAVEVDNAYSFHNTYLDVWFNTGLLGLVLYAGSQVYFIYRVLYLRKRVSGPEGESRLALVLGYMLGFGALGMVESLGAGASNVNIVLYLFLGVLVSDDRLVSAHGQQVEAARAAVRLRSMQPGVRLRAKLE